jgi:IS4 transposase
MVLGKMFEQFVDKAPVCVMARVALSNLFAEERLNDLFARVAQKQYTRTLLFSTMTKLMSDVVFENVASLRAAFQRDSESIGVSVTAMYNKINGVEPGVCATLVQESARCCRDVIRAMKAERQPLVPGFRVRILDGNHFPGTEHRLEELRRMRAAALPGQALVVLDPALRLALRVFPCEDGHTQERALLDPVLATVEKGDLWIADRNFCTTNFLFGISARQGGFLIRQHKSTLHWKPLEKCVRRGKCETGKLFEQPIELSHPETGETIVIRRIVLKLDTPTRDGDREIHLLTNLTEDEAVAVLVAETYRERWQLENVFLELTQTLNSEIRTLGYPAAAIFGFCLALAAYNAISLIKAAMSVEFGWPKIESEVSGYYLSEEIARTTPGMLIALPEKNWIVFENLSPKELAKTLVTLAQHTNLTRYKKHPRGPKRPQPKKSSGAKIKHVATARILKKRKPAKPPR